MSEGNQIRNFISSSGSGTVINYGSSSGSDFLTSYGSGFTSQKVTVPTVTVPQCCPEYLEVRPWAIEYISWTLRPVFRIWIRLDPHWYGFPGSVFRIGNAGPDLYRIQLQENWPKLTHKADFQPFKMAFVPIKGYVLCTVTYIKYIFHVKIQLFTTAKSDQDLDPHGSKMV